MIDEDRYKPFDRLSNDKKLQIARREYRETVDYDRSFQSLARKCYRFYNAEQYTTEEKRLLEKAGRPALVGNLIKATVELVKGVNDMNRVQARAEPTERNDQFLADILNDVYDKVRNIEDIEQEEDDVFENAVITGKGYIAVDVAPDPKRPGEIRIPIVSIPVNEVREDPSGRFIYWEKWVTLEDFAIQYPDFVDDVEEILSGESIGDLGSWNVSSPDEYGSMSGDTPIDEDYSNVLDDGFYDKSKGLIKIIHKEYWAVYERYYGMNPTTGQIEEFQEDKLPLLKKMIPNFQFQKIKDKKIKWFQFIGHKVLYDGDSPIPYDGFSIVGEYVYKNKSGNKIDYFGLVKDMIDPQIEANKRWSQTLNLYLKQSQGGYFVEEGAVSDAQQWKDTIRSPGEDTVVADGAIANVKIKEKKMPEFPTGAYKMNEFAQDLIKKISGVNPDLLGMDRGRTEPGIVVNMRRQQGLILLNNIFTGHKRLVKSIAKRIFAIVMAYMPESQIQRILGDSKDYVFRGDLVADLKNRVVAPIRNIKDLKYNVDVADAPSNIGKTMAQLAIFMDMMGKGFPVDPEAVIDKLDIPEADKSRWIEYIEQSKQSNMMQAQAKAGEIQAKFQVAQNKILSDQKINMEKLTQKEINDRRKFEIELAKLDTKSQELIIDLIHKLSGEQKRLPAPQSKQAYVWHQEQQGGAQ